MKEKMLEFIERIDEPSCFLMVTDSGIKAQARGNEMLAMLCTVIHNIKDGIPKKELYKTVDLAYMSDEELAEEEFFKMGYDKELKALEDFRKELNKFIEELENGSNK